MLPADRTLRARRFAPVHLASLDSIYDIQRAVADEATKPIYFESRIAKLALNAAKLPKPDAEFEEITEGEELTKKESRAACDAAYVETLRQVAGGGLLTSILWPLTSDPCPPAP